MSQPIAAGKSSFDLVNPDLVFAELSLQPDSVLLDLACGAGNYALAAAALIGPKGAIHAFDLWPEGIAMLRERARSQGLVQVKAEVADVSRRLPLPNRSVDAVLMATVLHDLVEVGAGEGALREAARLLRPGGRLAVVEFEKVDSHPGPPVAMRLSPDQAESLVGAFGFRRDRLVQVGNPLYALSFIRTFLEGQISP
jgi:ubiquinone/menaquinone biosynthesis C-methylase UbiE